MTLHQIVSARRRSLLTLLAILVVGGIAAGFALPVALFPNVRFPRIAVTVDAGDRPIDQTETMVTRPVESALRAVQDVQSIRTTTSRGEVEVSINFRWGSDMDLALQRVDAAMSQSTQAMSGVTYATRRMDPVVFPIAAYSLTSSKASLVELREFADRVLAPMLTTVNGVMRAESQGGEVGEYRITIDPEALRALGLTLNDVSAAIANDNILSAAGKLEDRGKLLLVLNDSRLTDIRQIIDAPIHTAAGGVVRVGDVAKVTAAPAPQWIRVTADGKDAVLINLYQQRGGNTVQIVAAAQKVFKAAQKLGPAKVNYANWYDQSQLITRSASALRDAIVLGVALAGLVLFVFLRDWKITLAAVIVVPATLAVTTLMLSILGQSFNIMTLGGMAAAIGLIIDDAIVMLEHVERRMQGTERRAEEVVPEAAAEFLKPLFGSSAATLVIFAPLAFLSGVTGAFFKALSLTMASALAISFLFAWWVVPVIAERLLSGRAAAPVNTSGRLISLYRSTLRAALAAPRVTLICALAFGAVGIVAFTHVGSGFMPKVDEGGFTLDYIAPPGSSLSETDRLLRQVEAVIRANPAVETYSRRTGAQLGGGLTEPNTGDIFIRLKNGPRPPIDEVMTHIREDIQKQVPGLEIETSQLMEDLIGDLTDVPQPIEIQLYGPDYGQLQDTAKRVAALIGGVRGVTEIKDGIVVVGDSLAVTVDPVKAALEGIDRAEAARQISGLISGVVDTQVQSGAYLVNLRVWTPPLDRDRQAKLLDAPLKAADGHLFPLKDIATLSTVSGQSEIERQDLQRMEPVTARVEGRDTGSAAKEIIGLLHKPGVLPAGITYKLGGLYAQQIEAFRGMAVVFVGAVGALFVLLLFLFENFRIAAAILAAPLLSVTAVAIGLLVTGVELNIMALMGATMILGITTEVAIFYFTEFDALLLEGMDRVEALVTAGANRLRPIAMTTLAAILALIPLALALGAGAAMEQPLAIAIIAGLLAQGPIVLWVMPALFRLIGGLEGEASQAPAS